jgi:hypothetical protein
VDVSRKITELQENGFCVLREHLPKPLIEAAERRSGPSCWIT